MELIEDKILIDKISQLPNNLKLDALKFIDYLIFRVNQQKTYKKKENIFDKYFGIAENLTETDAQEYVNKLREDDRF